MAILESCSQPSPATGDVAELARRWAVGFTATARVRRLKSELESLQASLQELSASRLQRWFRALRWRRRILPRQLLRAKLLISSCLTIQAAWRASRRIKQTGRLHVEAQDALVLDEPKLVIEAEVIDDNPLSLDGRKLSTDTEDAASSDASDVLSAMQRPSNSSVDAPQSQVQGDELFPHLGRGGARAAAVWRGHRVRRALASRSVQTKMQQWHELYQLIADAEWGDHGRGLPSQHINPWVDVLYKDMAKLKEEVRVEYEAAYNCDVKLWGAARSLRRWRGWPRDLLRLPQLALEDQSRSPLQEEPSLFASTTLEGIDPSSLHDTCTEEQMGRGNNALGRGAEYSQVRPGIHCWDMASATASDTDIRTMSDRRLATSSSGTSLGPAGIGSPRWRRRDSYRRTGAPAPAASIGTPPSRSVATTGGSRLSTPTAQTLAAATATFRQRPGESSPVRRARRRRGSSDDAVGGSFSNTSHALEGDAGENQLEPILTDFNAEAMQSASFR